jgi:hypothetical protein
MAATINLPRGFKAVGILLFFGTTMAALAGTTLVWRGTVLDRIWALNPLAYKQLAPLGRTIGIPFLLLSGALAAAGAGWLRRRFWGWLLTVTIIATQVLGNLVNATLGDVLRGGIGFTIASGLLFYLLRPNVRAVFVGGNWPSKHE